MVEMNTSNKFLRDGRIVTSYLIDMNMVSRFNALLLLLPPKKITHKKNSSRIEKKIIRKKKQYKNPGKEESNSRGFLKIEVKFSYQYLQSIKYH